MTPADSPEAKARHLRALYREHGEAGYALVKAEWERSGLTEPLHHILATAYPEGRELAGQRYDYGSQCWRDREGVRVE